MADYITFYVDEQHPRVQMPVHFVPEVLYVYNVSDATIYIKAGSLRFPEVDNADFVVLPHSYNKFVPYKTTQEFSAIFEGSSAWPCIFYFRRGDETNTIQSDINGLYLPEITIDFAAYQELPPLPDPSIIFADFVYALTSNNFDVQFWDTSGNYIIAWLWDFGDGDTSSEQNPLHVYTLADTYPVTLDVMNAYGDTATVTKDVVVTGDIFPAPAVRAAFSYTNVAPTLEVVFTDESYGLSERIVSWLWDFDDGETSTEQNPTHVFPIEGTYNVSLTVTGNIPTTDIIINPVTFGAFCNQFDIDDWDNVTQWTDIPFVRNYCGDPGITVCAPVPATGSDYNGAGYAVSKQPIFFTLEFVIPTHLTQINVFCPASFQQTCYWDGADWVLATNGNGEFGVDITTTRLLFASYAQNYYTLFSLIVIGDGTNPFPSHRQCPP